MMKQFPILVLAGLLMATLGSSAFAQPRKEDADSVIKVFRLKYAQAATLADTLKQLYPQEKFSAGVDARTNSLILKGPESLLQAIEDLLMRLDEAADETAAPPNSGARPPAVSDSSGTNYRTLEQEAGAAAKELREMEWRRNNTDRSGPKEYQDRVFGKNEAQLKEMRERLRTKVAQAFEARQRALQAELAGLQDRLRDVSQSIEMRHRIADQIIDRRVADLLNPDLRWEASSAANELAPAKAPPPAAAPKTSLDTSETGPLVPARSYNPLGLGGDASDGPAIGTSLGKPEELRRLLDNAEQSLQDPEAAMAAWLAQLRKTNPKATEEDVRQHHPPAWEQRAEARRRLQLARDQLAAQIRLLELELQDAEGSYQMASEALSRTKKLVAAQAEPADRQLAAEQAVGQSLRRVERAKTLLELYLKIAPPEKKRTESAKD